MTTEPEAEPEVEPEVEPPQPPMDQKKQFDGMPLQKKNVCWDDAPGFVQKLFGTTTEPEAEPEVEPPQPPSLPNPPRQKKQFDGMMHRDLCRYCSQ